LKNVGTLKIWQTCSYTKAKYRKHPYSFVRRNKVFHAWFCFT